MRKYLALMIVGALTFGVVSFATAGEETQTESFKVKPSKLSKKKHQNIKFVNTIVTFNQPGGNQPPSANRTILDLPKQFKINNKPGKKLRAGSSAKAKTKYCKTDEAGLEQTASTEEAIAACGKKSVVSQPKGSSAVVTVGGLGDINVQVTAFNENGNKLLLYSKPTGDASGIPASILVGKLLKFGKVQGRPARAGSSGAFKQSLDVTIPPLAAGAISFFEVTIKKSTYIQAKCKPKKMKAQATTFFDGGATTTDDHTVKCKPKK